MGQLIRLEKALSLQGGPPAPSSPPPSPVLAPTPVKAPVTPTIPVMAFGKAQWERFFGDEGIEPALAPKIEQTLIAPVPFGVARRCVKRTCSRLFRKLWVDSP